MKDENGNDVAPVVGGPHDGEIWFTFEDTETFVPLRTTQNRPRYRMVGGEWRFDGYEPSDNA